MRLHGIKTGIFLSALALTSCSTSGPGIFAKKTPHEQYGQQISNAGLRETALGRAWFQAAENSLSQPLHISLPYQETGYFAAEKPRAAGLQFQARRGEKLHIRLEKRPVSGFSLYIDLWESPASGTKARLLTAGDSTGKPLEYEVKSDGSFILRIQPELLRGGEYTLSISLMPSLAFPVPASIKATIGSLWGAGRDRGSRKHEGIDIFARFRSPVIACAEGYVSRVNENNLGGKVVWLRPANKDFTIYYAHLDTQMVKEGQRVLQGDTLGLVGNTGNARTTAPHLHFGIYAAGGAIDPFPFVNPIIKDPEAVTASLKNLGRLVRSNKAARVYEAPATGAAPAVPIELNTPLDVEAATAGWYKVTLPGGRKGFIPEAAVSNLDKPLRRLSLTAGSALFDQPDSLAARKLVVPAGEWVNILASYNRFFLVSTQTTESGWILKQ